MGVLLAALGHLPGNCGKARCCSLQGVTLALTVFVDLIAAVAVGCVLSSLIYVNYMAVQQLKNCEIITASNLHPGTGLTNGNRVIGAKETELLKDSDGGSSSHSLLQMLLAVAKRCCNWSSTLWAAMCPCRPATAAAKLLRCLNVA